MPTEQELLERIRELEAQNSALQDKLDAIWSILAEDYEDDDARSFIQIELPDKDRGEA